MILRCQGCQAWHCFHDDDAHESRIVDEMAAFLPAHVDCGAHIDVAVLPAQRHAPAVPANLT